MVQRDDSNGQWYINVNSAILKEWQEKYVDVRKDKGVVTKPPGLAAPLWGGWAWLQEAEKRGEILTVTSEGKYYYQWREFSEIEREGQRGGLARRGDAVGRGGDETLHEGRGRSHQTRPPRRL